MTRPAKSRLQTLYPPRGMRAAQAAAYLGMSESTFLALVKEGLMPLGIRIRGMTIWDREDLDYALENLKASQLNTFNALLDREDERHPVRRRT